VQIALRQRGDRQVFNDANGPNGQQIAANLSAAKGSKGDSALDGALAILSEGASKFPARAHGKHTVPGTTTTSSTAGMKEAASKTAESVTKSSKEVLDNAKKDAANREKEAVQGMSTSTLIILGVVVALVLLFAREGSC